LEIDSDAGAFMWNANTPPGIDEPVEQRYLLTDNIAAMEVIPSTAGESGLGPMLRLPKGAAIEYCGEGFNEQTVKVRWHGKLYFVYREDLATQRKPTARFACC
jgi:hypothetical protein